MYRVIILFIPMHSLTKLNIVPMESQWAICAQALINFQPKKFIHPEHLAFTITCQKCSDIVEFSHINTAIYMIVPITPLAQHLIAFAMVGHFVIKGLLGVGHLSLLSVIVSNIDICIPQVTMLWIN